MTSAAEERRDEDAGSAGPVAPAAGRRRDLPLVVRLAGWTSLVAALLAANVAILAPRFHYAYDDFLQFVTAREDGLSWSLLSLNVFQHFAPYNRFAHWVVYEYTGLSPVAGLAVLLVSVAGLLAASLWLMTELRLSTPRRVVALLLMGLSVSTTETAIWFDGGMHIATAVAVTLAVVAAHVRGVRTGRWRWHTLALVLFLLGQLVQERPLFALPLIVLVDLLLLWRALPWRTRLRRLWALRGPLAPMVVAALVIAGLLRTYVVVDSYETPSWWITGRTMVAALTNYVVPSLVNQPLERPVDPSMQLVVLAGLVLVGVGLATMRRFNAGPVLFAAATFVLYYGFLKFSPLLNEDTVTVNAERLNYAIYVLVPSIIAGAHLRLPAAADRLRRVVGSRRVRHGLQVAGCLGLAAYLLISNVTYLDRRWAPWTEGRAYLDAVRAAATEWADARVTVLSLRGHPALTGGWSRYLGRHENLLPLLDEGVDVGAVGPRPVAIDAEGTVRPAVLETVRPDLEVVEGGCDRVRPRLTRDAFLALSPLRDGEPLFLRLDYRADTDVEVLLSGGWNRSWRSNDGTSVLPAGSHTRLVPIDASRLAVVDLRVLTEGGGLCVEDAAVVRALFVDGDGERCREMDWYGRPGARADCPQD